MWNSNCHQSCGKIAFDASSLVLMVRCLKPACSTLLSLFSLRGWWPIICFTSLGLLQMFRAPAQKSPVFLVEKRERTNSKTSGGYTLFRYTLVPTYLKVWIKLIIFLVWFEGYYVKCMFDWRIGAVPDQGWGFLRISPLDLQNFGKKYSPWEFFTHFRFKFYTL